MNHCPDDPIGIDAVPEQCFFRAQEEIIGRQQQHRKSRFRGPLEDVFFDAEWLK